MNDNVKPWPKPTGTPMETPKRIVRPCDCSLRGTVFSLEQQLGTIEAYNRLVEVAEVLRARIDAGKAEAQHPMFAVSVTGEQK